MKYEAFYLIEPKPLLAEICSKYDVDVQELFCNQRLWKSYEGGKSSWSTEGRCASCKLAFLLYILKEYDGLNELTDIFQNEKISIKLFDKYWKISAVALEGCVDEVENNSLSKDSIELTEMVDVDNWLMESVLQK